MGQDRALRGNSTFIGLLIIITLQSTLSLNNFSRHEGFSQTGYHDFTFYQSTMCCDKNWVKYWYEMIRGWYSRSTMNIKIIINGILWFYFSFFFVFFFFFFFFSFEKKKSVFESVLFAKVMMEKMYRWSRVSLRHRLYTILATFLIRVKWSVQEVRLQIRR